MDVEERYLQKIEGGKLHFGVVMLVVIAEALETTPARLLKPATPAATRTGRPAAKTKGRGPK